MALSELVVAAKDGLLSSISGGLKYFVTPTGANAPGVVPLDGATGLPVSPATAAGQASQLAALGSPAQDGTDATGITAPTGGVGIRGWLSGNYQKLTAIAASLAGTLTTVLAAGSAIIGKVGIDQTTPGTTNGVYDTSYATHVPVMCQITIPASGNASALSINTLLSAANAANSALCPITTVPSWATIAYIQVPTTGAQVNFTCSTNLPTAGTAGYGTMIYPGNAGTVPGQAAIAALELIASSSQIVNIQFGG